MTAYVALLRAINVGGRATLAMADLRAMAESLGLEAPRTVLQSGNLLFSSDECAGTLGRRIEAALAARHALATDVLVRSGGDWRAILDANPFVDLAGAAPAKLLVVPLTDAPDASALAALRAAIRGPEQVALVGSTAYLAYPEGIGRSKLTLPLAERHLGARATARNWSTACKIAAMLTP